MIKLVKDWLTSTENPRWALISGAVGIFALSLGGDFFLDEVGARRSEIESQVDSIRLTATDFDVFAANYVAAILDSSSEIPDKRRALLDAVTRQHSQVSLLLSEFEGPVRDSALRYQKALTDLHAEIQEVDEVLELGGFWEHAAGVIEARNAFINQLDSSSSPIF